MVLLEKSYKKGREVDPSNPFDQRKIPVTCPFSLMSEALLEEPVSVPRSLIWYVGSWAIAGIASMAPITTNKSLCVRAVTVLFLMALPSLVFVLPGLTGRYWTC